MDNHEAWIYPKDAGGENFQITSSLAYLNGVVYAGVREGSNFGLAKFALNKEPGQPPAHTLLGKSKNSIVLSPAVKGNSVYFVDGKRGDTGRTLCSITIESGENSVLLPVESMAAGEFTVIGDQLVIADRTNSIRSVTLSKTESRWSYSCGGCTSGPPCGSEGRIAVAFKDPNKLALLDSETGGELWSVTLDSAPTTGPIMVEQMICVGTERGVAGYQLLDGKQSWCQEAVNVAAPLVNAEGKLGCVGTNKTLLLLDAIDGRMLKSFPGLGE